MSTRVAVIVTAHQRRAFYREAVESALALDPGPLTLEYALLRDFEEPETDAGLIERGVNLWPDRSTDVGGSLSTALAATHADFLAFVDDDDLLFGDRWAAFAEVLEATPDLSYYHHGFQMFAGAPPAWKAVPSALPRNSGTGRSILEKYRPNDGERLLRFLARANHERNLSSTIVRRSTLEAMLPELTRLRAMTDTCALFAGLLSPGTLVFDRRVFALVRRHSANVSKSATDIRRRADAFDLFSEMAVRRNAPTAVRSYLKLRGAREAIYNRVLGAPASHRTLVSAGRRVLRFGLRHQSVRDLEFAALAGAGLLLPFSIPAMRRWLLPI